MAKALLSPYSRGKATRVGKRMFRKQVLPLTTIDYEGRKITFDRPFLQDLADSFNAGAYAQVPFIFADGENRHQEQPERFRGDVKAMELTDTGLDMIVETTQDGYKVIKDNPKLGVSARIIEGVARADGKSFPRAIRHVLGTLFPKVPDMGPWTAVDLAEDPDISEVVDLTAESYDEEEGVMGKTKTKRGRIDLTKLSDEQFEDLLDLAEAATLERDDAAVEDEDEDAEVDEDEESDDDEAADKTKVAKKKSKVKTTKVVERESEGDEDDEDGEEQEDDTLLSDSKSKSKTRRVRETDADRRIRTVEVNLAAEAFRNDKANWIRDGVPPFLIDLAAPVLALPDAQVIDLSDGKTGDARDILRKMLDGVKGIIDLSAEMGSSIDLSDLGKDDDPDADLIAEYDKQYS